MVNEMSDIFPIVRSSGTVLLVGGGDCDNRELLRVLKTSDVVVAADGGAMRLQDLGVTPHAVVGDFDSIDPAVLSSLPQGVAHHIAEQNSTDFDKCLRNIDAALILGMGFQGRRMDHAMAALTVLVRHASRRCILLGAHDVIVVAPPAISLDLPIGSRLSLYPLALVRGTSTGLEWPIDGLAFEPDGQIGTSNRVTGPVRLTFDRPGMLLILPPEAAPSLQSSLLDPATGSWPVHE